MAKCSVRSRCACGQVKSSDATECRKCARAKSEARYNEAEAIVAAKVCPQCGSPLERNLALTGWWQCVAYGEPSMRKREHASLPKCGFQTFTRR